MSSSDSGILATLRRLAPGSRTTPFRRRLRFHQSGAAVPEKPDQAVRLLTLNLAHGRGPRQTSVRRPRLERNLNRVAEALRGVDPDIVALQEADGPSAWSGNFDHVATLATLAELDDHFRGDHHHWGTERFHVNSGTALLAKHPLDEQRSHRFAENWRDTKGFVAATVEVPQWGERKLDVVSVHLDFLKPQIRQRQIGQLIERLEDRDHPLVILGDLNCCFDSEPESMRMLAEALSLTAFQPESESPTYPSFRPVRRLDWILISPHLQFGGYGTLPLTVSDHLIVAADLLLSESDD